MAIPGITSIGTKSSDNAPTRRDAERSFADVYKSTLRATSNDNAVEVSETTDPKSLENRKVIADLRYSVESLRGEILARVIETARKPINAAPAAAEDISRLSVRLDRLRQKLEREETRLSGKLVDINI